MTFWHTKRPKHASTLLPHDIALPLMEDNSGIACRRTQIIEHNSGNTRCAVGKKSDHHDSPLPLNNVAVANLFDTICPLSPHILHVRNVTILTNFHLAFAYTPFLMWVVVATF
jgi:hypothetical protein